MDRVRPATIHLRSCSEAGCDRDALRGDARCALHASRLGHVPVEEPEVADVQPLESAPVQKSAAPPGTLLSTDRQDESWMRWGAISMLATVGFWAVLPLYWAALNHHVTDGAGEMSPTLHTINVAALTVGTLASPLASAFAFYRARSRGQNVLSWIMVLASVVTLFMGAYVGIERLRSTPEVPPVHAPSYRYEQLPDFSKQQQVPLNQTWRPLDSNRRRY